MAYLGVTPTQEFSSVAKQSVTGDGSVSYTLNKGVSDANDLAVFVNDVRQEPGVAYTASGNTITFTANLESTDDCYILHIGRTFSSAESPGIEDKATQKVLTITTDGHLVPTANVTYDLGTSDLRFRDIYLSGSSIELGDHSITANATHISMGNVVTTGVMTGNGALVTSLNASELTSGTIPLARLPDDVTIVNDLTIGGDFIVNGNTTTIAANELKVEDSLIQLASNNEISDTVDIGFVGHYYDGSTQVHTGFFRDASDEQYYLFKGYEDADFDTDTPPATIDRTANTFALADLNVGGLNATTSVEATTAFRAYNSVSAAYRNVLRYDSGNVRLETGSSGSEAITAFTGGSERMRIDSSGNVGINTTNPLVPLHVETSGTSTTIGDNAAVTLRSKAAGRATTLQFSDGSTANWISALSGNLGFATSNTERMRINSSGQVAIGQTTHSNTNVKIDLHNSGTGVGTQIAFYNDHNSSGYFIGLAGNTTGNIIYYNVANTAQDFYNNNAFAMTLSADGKLGIGITNPATNLHILDSNPVVRLQSSGAGTDNTLSFLSRNISNVGAYADIIAEGAGHNSTNAPIVFTQGSGQTERMRIDSSGNVGIGTVSPNKPLEISKTNGGAVIRLNNPDSTVSSGESLGSIEWQSNDASTPGGTGTQAVINVIDTNTYGNAYAMTFTTSDSGTTAERMRISSSGNVAIGDDDAQYKLDVSTSNLNSPIFRIGYNSRTWAGGELRMGQLNAADGYSSYLQGYEPVGNSPVRAIALNPYGGNVGIGTTTPSERLELTRTAGKIGWGMNGNYGVRIGYFDDGGGTHGLHIDTKHVGTTTSESRFVVRADSGNVGIGTKSPRYNLAVKGSNATAVGIAVDNDTGGCQIDVAALGSSYNAHGASANEAWLFCANNINLGSATGQTSAVKFLSGGSENARIDADGIKFNGDTAAANALDDYEEGTWTPTVSTSSSVTIYRAQYTKIGRTVTVSCYIAWTNNQNNNTGTWNIGGLPYQSALSYNYEAAAIGYTGAVKSDDFLLIKHSNSSYYYLHRSSGGNSNVFSNADITTRGLNTIIFTGTYQLPS